MTYEYLHSASSLLTVSSLSWHVTQRYCRLLCAAGGAEVLIFPFSSQWCYLLKAPSSPEKTRPLQTLIKAIVHYCPPTGMPCMIYVSINLHKMPPQHVQAACLNLWHQALLHMFRPSAMVVKWKRQKMWNFQANRLSQHLGLAANAILQSMKQLSCCKVQAQHSPGPYKFNIMAHPLRRHKFNPDVQGETSPGHWHMGHWWHQEII